MTSLFGNTAVKTSNLTARCISNSDNHTGFRVRFFIWLSGPEQQNTVYKNTQNQWEFESSKFFYSKHIMYNCLQNQSLSLGQKRALNKVRKSERTKMKTDLCQGLKMDETHINQNFSGQLFWPRLYITLTLILTVKLKGCNHILT